MVDIFIMMLDILFKVFRTRPYPFLKFCNNSPHPPVLLKNLKKLRSPLSNSTFSLPTYWKVLKTQTASFIPAPPLRLPNLITWHVKSDVHKWILHIFCVTKHSDVREGPILGQLLFNTFKCSLILELSDVDFASSADYDSYYIREKM